MIDYWLLAIGYWLFAIGYLLWGIAQTCRADSGNVLKTLYQEIGSEAPSF
ncbi:MAG: hypothetical protein U7126_08165 [Microcoleus sp.]